MKYGKVVVRAKMPRGKLIWPAIWMLPKHAEFGNWPSSGEIDIVESRGDPKECNEGVDSFGSTLHWGPRWDKDPYQKGHAVYKHTEELSKGFHDYELEWTKDHIITRFDGKTVLEFKHD